MLPKNFKSTQNKNLGESWRIYPSGFEIGNNISIVHEKSGCKPLFQQEIQRTLALSVVTPKYIITVFQLTWKDHTAVEAENIVLTFHKALETLY